MSIEGENLLPKFPLEAPDDLEELAADLGVTVEEVRERILHVCKLARDRLEENRQALGMAGDAKVIAFPERPNAPDREHDSHAPSAAQARVLSNWAVLRHPSSGD